MTRKYVRPLRQDSAHEQVTEVTDHPILGGMVKVGIRYETREGSWRRFVVVPRRPGRTTREYNRLAMQHGIDIHGSYYSHPGGRFYHEHRVRYTRTRVLFTQSGGLDI